MVQSEEMIIVYSHDKIRLTIEKIQHFLFDWLLLMMWMPFLCFMFHQRQQNLSRVTVFFRFSLWKDILLLNFWWRKNWNWPKTDKMTKFCFQRSLSLPGTGPRSQEVRQGEWQDVHQYQVMFHPPVLVCPPSCYQVLLLVDQNTTTVLVPVQYCLSYWRCSESYWFSSQCNCSNLCWSNQQFRGEISKQIDNTQYFRIGLLIATVQSLIS